MKKNLTLLSLLLCSSLSALPFGEDVKAGEATFYSNDKTLSIITSEKTIINYQEFNIGQGEVVQFIQPSANSSVLNRVTGGNCSEILGRLESNGQVFLVNAQGIYFGPNAIVNVGSIVATSLSIRDDFFLQDSLEFFLENKTSGSIVNEGMILADGFAALFAPTVQNQGSIYARAGQVFLGASEKVILDLMGDGLIKVLVEGDLEKALYHF